MITQNETADQSWEAGREVDQQGNRDMQVERFREQQAITQGKRDMEICRLREAIAQENQEKGVSDDQNEENKSQLLDMEGPH